MIFVHVHWFICYFSIFHITEASQQQQTNSCTKRSSEMRKKCTQIENENKRTINLSGNSAKLELIHTERNSLDFFSLVDCRAHRQTIFIFFFSHRRESTVFSHCRRRHLFMVFRCTFIDGIMRSIRYTYYEQC